jgi:predicted transcriptional regulator
MSPKASPDPTEAELRILRALWDQGPGTVREIHRRLEGDPVGYTTVLKLLQLMHEKGLVSRERAGPHTRAHVYAAAIERDAAERGLLRRLAHRVFDGSLSRLAVQAMSATDATPDEIARIRRLLDGLEEPRA